MNDTERIEKHHGGPHLDKSKPHRPYWKRVRHSKFFWVGAALMLLAMAAFVLTDGLLLRPHVAAPASVRAGARP
jgi:hypothetical protein